MSLISRLKRLWELSGQPPAYYAPTDIDLTTVDGDWTNGDILPVKEGEMAVIVDDDPLEAFPPENNDNPGERTSTD